MKKLLFLLIIIFLTVLSSCKQDTPDDWIITKDGWKLPVFIYSGNKNKPAIIYLHGLGANHNNFNGYKGFSFAELFSKEGYGGYSIDFRGHGQSYPVSDKKTVSTDDMIYYDLPALLDFVRKMGVKKYFLLGHSMGGMVALEYAALNKDPDLLGIVPVAGPVTFTVGTIRRIGKLINLTKIIRPFTNKVYNRIPAYLLKPFVGYLMNLPELNFLGNPENMNPQQLSTLLTRAVSDLPLSIVPQFKDAMEKKSYNFKNGMSYFDPIKNISVPILMIAGSADNLVDPYSVIMEYDRIASKDKTLVIAGQANGFRENYGHIDLVVGKYALEEIFTIINKWVINHSGKFKNNASYGGGDRIRTGE